jgi:hypothetical protein
MKAPCKDCKERHQGCHAECEQYQIYHAECVKASKKRKVDSLLKSQCFDRITRMRSKANLPRR